MNNEKQGHEIAPQSDKELSEEASTNKASTEELSTKPLSKEIGGREHGLDPTRYGDWEFKGRCIDF